MRTSTRNTMSTVFGVLVLVVIGVVSFLAVVVISAAASGAGLTGVGRDL